MSESTVPSSVDSQGRDGHNEGLLAEFEVRGLELINWHPDAEGFYIKCAESGAKIDDIDQLDGFVDLDEESGLNVIIETLDFRIE